MEQHCLDESIEANRKPTDVSYSLVFKLAYPVTLTMVFQTLVGLATTIMVGRLETSQLGATGLGSMIAWTFLSFFNGIISTASTFVSQNYGANHHQEIGKNIWHYVYIAIFSYFAILLLTLFIGKILQLVGSSQEVQSHSLGYIRTQLLFGIGTFVSFALIGFFRGIGDTKTPMWVTLGVCCFNVILAYLIVFGKLWFPRMEMKGVAVSNGVSGILSAVIYSFILFSKKYHEPYGTRKVSKVDLGLLRSIIKVGAPAGVQFFLDTFSFSFFFAVIARISDSALAASNAVMTLMSMTFMPLFGASVAATTLVGQFVGAGRIKEARKSGYTSIKMGVVIGAIGTLCFLLLPRQLMSMFSKDPSVVDIGKKILILTSLTRISEGIGICSGGALRGVGDTKFPMFVGIICAWVIFIPFTYILGISIGGGAIGSWIASVFYIFSYDLLVFLRFRSKRWEKIKVINS